MMMRMSGRVLTPSGCDTGFRQRLTEPCHRCRVLRYCFVFDSPVPKREKLLPEQRTKRCARKTTRLTKT